MNTIPLARIAEINPTIPKDIEKRNGFAVSFLPMAGVSEDGYVAEVDIRTLDEVSKGYRYFERGDVLLAKITPCMENGKAALASDLPHQVGFGSTEFHVLRPRHGTDARFLFYAVWNPQFRYLARKAMTGAAGQKRVPTDFLKSYEVPNLPEDEQQRIAAILDKANAIRRKRKEALTLADDFLKSAFLDMFGDPVTNPKGWKTRKVSDICRLVRGSSPRPKSDPRYYGGSVPRLMVADLTRDGWFVTPQIDSLTEEGAKSSRPVPKGTIAMAVSGNVGLVGMLTVDACVHDGFVAFLGLDDAVMLPEYLMLCLHFLKITHEQRRAGAIFQNLTTADIKAMELPCPCLSQQHQFLDLFMRLQKHHSLHSNAYDEAKEVCESLAQWAFKEGM